MRPPCYDLNDRGVIGTDVVTRRLIEVKDDLVVLEVRAVDTRMGKTSTQKPYTTAVRRLDVAVQAGVEGLDLLRPKGAKAGTGTEAAIKLGKAEYKTVRYFGEHEDAFGDNMAVTVWLSADVPGCVVKRDVRVTGKRRAHHVTEFKWAAKP